eukprot:jgi/Mesen1/10122/ME000075S09627
MLLLLHRRIGNANLGYGAQRCRAVCREWERAACGLVEFVSLIAARPGHGQPWGRSGRSGGAGAGSGGREDDIDDDDNDDWDACAADSVLQELRRYPSVKRVRVGAAAEIRAASYVRVLTRLACADPAEELVALTSLDLVYWHHHPGPGCCALGSGVGSGVGSGLGSESGSGAEAWSPGSRGSAWGSVLGGWGGVSREAWEEPGEVHLGEVQSPLQALDALLTRRQGTLVKLSLTLVNPEEFASDARLPSPAQPDAYFTTLVVSSVAVHVSAAAALAARAARAAAHRRERAGPRKAPPPAHAAARLWLPPSLRARCGRPLPSYRTFFRLGALAELRALSIRSPVESPLPDSLWVLSGLQHLRLTVEESSGSSNSSRNQGFGFGRPRLLVPRRRPLHASNPNPSTNFDPCNLNTTGTLLPTRQRGLYPNYNPSPNPNAIGIQSLNPLLRFNPDPDPGRNTNPNPNPMPEWPLLPQAPHVDLGPLDRPFENLKGLREVELRMLDIRSGLSEGEATALLSIPTLTALSVHALRQRCSRNSALRGHGPPAHAHAHAQAHPHHLRQRNNDGNVGAVGRAHVNARAGANASSVRAREHAHARALQALLYWPGLSRLSLDLFELPPMPSGHLMPRLRELTLVVHLSTFEHDFFRHLPNLTHLDVTLYNVFVWPTLGNLLHLTSLRIGFLNPSSKLPGGFSPPALKKLELADCTMRSRLPEILGHQNLSDEVAVSLSCPCKRCIDAGIFIV